MPQSLQPVDATQRSAPLTVRSVAITTGIVLSAVVAAGVAVLAV
jgi:hypothetical protein